MYITQAAQCPANELYYTDPSPMCDINCQNLQRRCPLTSIRPVAGCYCRPNYALKDCDSNEIPISPNLTNCEKICPIVSAVLRTSVCYHIMERRCICAAQYCRNQRAQCVRNFKRNF
ncbi:hypothetical protein CVS40_3213 [Lucilia cuprina]|nr:hypothetical protein CVS40_3213 [Lucilia cuprina]